MTRLPLCLALLLSASLHGPAAAREARSADPASGSDSAIGVPLDHLPALAGGYFPLASPDTGGLYHVYVRLPEGYADAPNRRWPVVYVLDGDSLFPLLAPTHLFLGYDEGLPEAIIVGIASGGFDPAVNRRNLDFTAAGARTRRPGRAAPRPISASCAGGCCRRSSAATARRPRAPRAGGPVARRVFRALVRAPRPGPVLGPDRQQSLARARAGAAVDAPAAHRRGDLRVVVASGTRDTAARVRHATEWTTAWQQRTDAPWDLALVVLPEGTHAASIGEAYRRAMLHLFREDMLPRP